MIFHTADISVTELASLLGAFLDGGAGEGCGGKDYHGITLPR